MCQLINCIKLCILTDEAEWQTQSEADADAAKLRETENETETDTGRMNRKDIEWDTPKSKLEIKLILELIKRNENSKRINERLNHER